MSREIAKMMNDKVMNTIQKSLNDIIDVSQEKKINTDDMLGFVVFTILNSAFEMDNRKGHEMLYQITKALEDGGHIGVTEVNKETKTLH